MRQFIRAPFEAVDVVQRVDAIRTVLIAIAIVIFQFQYVGVPAIVCGSVRIVEFVIGLKFEFIHIGFAQRHENVQKE